MRTHQEIESPCRDCTERIPPTREDNGCRAYCEKLKEYEALKKAEYAERKRVMTEEQVIWDYKHEAKLRFDKFMRTHRKADYKKGRHRR